VTGVADARERFAKANLPFPPIPPDLQPRLEALDDFLFGTRHDGPRPYSLQWYVDELVAGSSVAPYVLTGHDGRGMNSWAIHYLLVHGPLGVFDQIPWGGAYSDDVAAVQLMKVHWTQITDLLGAVEAAAARGLLAADERYIVVCSDFFGSRWWRGRLGDEPAWRRGRSLEVLVEAAIDAQEMVEEGNVR